jgi:hypothetical protein
MGRTLLIACALTPLVLAGVPALAADSEADQLREQLRSTVLQLRQLQDQQAAQAAQPAAPGPDATAMKAKLDAAQGQLRAARRSAAEAASLKAALAKAQADSVAAATAAQAQSAELDKYKAAYSQAADAGHALAVERDRLKAQLAQTTTIATACQAKNVKLTAFAEGLLADERKIGFGQVLAGREPVLGLRRVQLENIAQDREDQVRADRCDAQLDGRGPAKAATPGG